MARVLQVRKTMITEQQLEPYRTMLRRRAQAAAREQAQRRAQARATARRLAEWIKGAYGAEHVALFGSVAREDALGPRSDIDLAVWGVAPSDYFEAVARAQDRAAPFTVDLIQMEHCTPSLRAHILQEGIEL